MHVKAVFKQSHIGNYLAQQQAALERIYTDLYGPMPTQSVRGARYFWQCDKLGFNQCDE